jgi:hypothetical protein
MAASRRSDGKPEIAWRSGREAGDLFAGIVIRSDVTVEPRPSRLDKTNREEAQWRR